MKRSSYAKPDYYARKAKARGFPARSVFKLEELDGKYRLLSPGMKVLDLGAAPGSWMKYCGDKVGGRGMVVGIDRSPLSRQTGKNEAFIQSDVFMIEPGQIRAQYGQFDLVLSDLAPDTTGNRLSDNARSIALCERAYQFARALLKPGGKLLVKAFQGGEFEGFVKSLRESFAGVDTTKPKSSRPGSREMYVYARNFKKRADKLVRRSPALGRDEGGSVCAPNEEKR